MKNVIAILIALTISCGAFAQSSTTSSTPSSTKYSIKGIAIDSTKNEPAMYATATLSDTTGKAIVAAYSDEKGKFEIKARKGSYKFRLVYVGYAPFEKDIELSEDIDLGTISIMQGIEIGAAVVVGKLITSDIDKTTYNTSVDPEAASLTALEMMRKVPMLSVDGDDNLKLKGEGNFKILVNGKSSAMMGSNYKDVLKSMPASSIKNIEVITNPPAKYDAEGIGGIINIITTRKVSDGFSGSIGAGADSFGGWRGNGYIATSVGKFNLSVNAFGGMQRQPSALIDTYRENLNPLNSPNSRYVNTNASGFGKGFYGGLNLEASYEFDSLNLLSFSVSGFLGGGNEVGLMRTVTMNERRDTTGGYDNNINSKRSFGSIEAGLDYQRSFAKNKSEMLTASYKFNYNPNGSNYTSDMEFFEELLSGIKRRSDNQAWGAEHTIQLDYINPFNKSHQLEIGAKYVLRPNVSNTLNERYDPITGVWNEELELKNDLDYMQHIGAAYAGYQYTFNKFSVKAGVRAEMTVNTGTFKNMDGNSSLFNRYFNIIPYASLGFKINDSQHLRLGYSQRISRPGIWNLNPYINDTDPMNISTGNPDLMPELSNSIDLSYGIYQPKFNINASLGVMLTGNSIEDIATINPNSGAMTTMPQNIGNRQRYSANLSSTVRMLNNKLTLNINASGAYVSVNTNNGNGLKNQGWEYGGYASLRADTWKNGSVGLSGGVWGPSVNLQGSGMLYYFSHIEIAQQLIKKTMRISLRIRDPWTERMYFNNTTSDASFRQQHSMSMQAQRIGIDISWRFGNMKGGVKKASRSIQNDDVKAKSESGGGMGGGQ